MENLITPEIEKLISHADEILSKLQAAHNPENDVNELDGKWLASNQTRIDVYPNKGDFYCFEYVNCKFIYHDCSDDKIFTTFKTAAEYLARGCGISKHPDEQYWMDVCKICLTALLEFASKLILDDFVINY